MRIVIIEDEMISAEDLVCCIEKTSSDVLIKAILQSVSEAVAWFQCNSGYDIIFSDIQLNDGTSFDIFKMVKIKKPVVFCTAYDQFALEAFRHNGIHYILKPFTQEIITDVMHRINLFKAASTIDYFGIETAIRNAAEIQQRDVAVLVNYKSKIIPFKIQDISFFYIEHNIVFLITFLNEKFQVGSTLDELEQLTGRLFYHANRQYLVNREAVLEMEQHFNRKLLLKLKTPVPHEIIINKIKVRDFLNWLRT